MLKNTISSVKKKNILKGIKLVSVLAALLIANGAVFSYGAAGHIKTTAQAFDILQTGDEKQRWIYGFYSYHATRSGTSVHATVVPAAAEPDNYLDTVIGGWWIGYRYFVEVQFLASANFTSYWHFLTAYRPGKHGDRYSGFSYALAPEDGFFGLNTILKTVLYNQEIKSGSYESAKGLVIGVKDIFQIVSKDWLGLAKDFYMGEEGSSKSWGLAGAPNVLTDYQVQVAGTDPTINGQLVGGKSRVPAGNWNDIQNAYFNPGSNASQYWYNLVTSQGEFDNISEYHLKLLGYMLHWIGDVTVPQHTWSTTDHNHLSFESHADEKVSQNWKVDKDKVLALVEQFRNSDMKTYAQKFAAGTEPAGGQVDGDSLNNAQPGGEGPAIKDLKVNGITDPTLYSAGDILRWVAEQAVSNNKVLSDDSEKTFNDASDKSLTLAVAGNLLILEKLAADLYKKKVYSSIVNAHTAPANGIWGNETFIVNGTVYNQIR